MGSQNPALTQSATKLPAGCGWKTFVLERALAGGGEQTVTVSPWGGAGVNQRFKPSNQPLPRGRLLFPAFDSCEESQPQAGGEGKCELWSARWLPSDAN